MDRSGGGAQASPQVSLEVTQITEDIWEYKAVVMAPPEDKVKLFDDDPKTPPSTTVVDENEEGSDICQLTCVSVVFLVVFGVFFSLVIFPSSPKGEDSYYDEGLYISQHSFFSFTLTLRGLTLGSVSRKFIYLLTKLTVSILLVA